MTQPAQALRRARRVVLFLTVALMLYGIARFDLVLLPEGARSPLHGLHPGDRLLVDRHARSGVEGDVWLYRGPGQELLLARVTTPPDGLAERERAALAEGALWLCFERELPDLADSRTLGPIGPEARVGRVVFVLPW